MTELLISGYYGYANSGDDALLLAMMQTIKEYVPDSHITVLSGNPAETRRLYGCEAVGRYDLPRVTAAMKKADLLIFGGGSLVQDGTSSKSLYYYLGIIRLAKKLGLPVMVYANGIGPLKRERNIRLAVNTLQTVDCITLRDENSYQELIRMGVSKPPMTVTADPAFALTPSDSARNVLRRAGVPNDMPYAVISVRKWKKTGPEFIPALIAACDALQNNWGLAPVFLPMQLSSDKTVSLEICSRMKTKGYLVEERLSAGDCLAVLERAQAVIGMRLHTLIFATAVGTPALALVYDPKIKGFMDTVNQNHQIAVETITPEKLGEALNAFFKDRDALSAALTGKCALLREKAKENGAILADLLDENRLLPKKRGGSHV